MSTQAPKHPTTVDRYELAWLRRRFGISLTEAAKILKTTRFYLRKIEDGQKPCHVRYAALYEKAFGKDWFRAMRSEYAQEQERTRRTYSPDGEAPREAEE